ncbi:MAG: magnesium transporter [Clostridia bacterium]|nr:magnesium transporter [Clostridia bacterium]
MSVNYEYTGGAYDEEALLALLDNRQYSVFMQTVEELNPVDVAEFFGRLPEERQAAVFRLLKKDTAAEVFAELESDVQERLIHAMSDREIGVIVDDLFSDDAVTLLGEMPSSVVKRIMKNAKPETRAEINRLLSYPEDSAGSVMTGEFLELRKSMTVTQAVETIRKTGLDKETVYVAYVTDAQRRLEGVVSLKDLLFAAPDAIIEDIMETNITSATTHDDQETVAAAISKYDLLVMPVVDMEGRLVGIVTVDDAMDVMEEEATEDIEKMAAILPTDKPYLKTSVSETVKARVPWLLILMLSATVTGAIITHYEAALGTWVVLTAFMPMIMGTGGNAGGQSSMTIIRSLSLGEVVPGDVLRVLWKELRVSLLCGIVMGLATFVKVFLIDLHADSANLIVAAVVSLTLVVTVVLAKLVGALLPIAVKKVGLDPAVMASPFVTTIVDALSLLLYFKIASLLLGI